MSISSCQWTQRSSTLLSPYGDHSLASSFFSLLRSLFGKERRQEEMKAGADSQKPESKPKRILVVGLNERFGPGIRTISWNSGSFPNIADFDVVIVDSDPLVGLLTAVEKGRDDRLWRQLKANVTSAFGGFRKLLESGGTIYWIVGSEKVIRYAPDGENMRPSTSYLSSYSWLPLPVELKTEEGETIEVRDEAFARYFEKVKRWKFYIEVSDMPPERLAHLVPERLRDRLLAQYSQEPIAQNRYGRYLAARVFFQLHEFQAADYVQRTALQVNRQPAFVSGCLYVLPPPTETDNRGAVLGLLEDFFGVVPRTLAPEWVQQVTVPGVDELVQERARKQESIAALEAEVRTIEEQITDLEVPRELLYESGLHLESICKRVLSGLGAIVKPAEASEEDFVVEFEGRKAVAEVKGNNKSISVDDLRQLGSYREDYAIRRSEEIKGILFGNAWRLSPPEDRQIDFPERVVAYAVPRGIALVSTVELFRAYCAVKNGRVKAEEVLCRLFEGQGVTKLLP